MKLKLCQFNVENLFIFLERRPENIPFDQLTEVQWQMSSMSPIANKKLEKCLDLAHNIKTINADIYLLNEVGGLESLKNFNDLFLESAYKIYHIASNSERGIDNAYLVKKRICAEYEIQLSSYKNREFRIRGSRYPIKFARDVLRLDIKLTDKTLSLLGVHLKSKLSRPGDYQGIERRKAEINELINIYLEVSSKRDAIICGDFNGLAIKEQYEPEYKIIYDKTNLLDIHDILNSHVDERFSHLHFLSKSKHCHKMQLDYIFLPPQLTKKIIKSETYRYLFKSLDDQEIPIPRSIQEKIKLPSDHYPQVVTLLF